MKKCSKCNIIKSIEHFYKKRNSHYSECKICHNKRSGERMRLIKQQCVDYKGGKCQHCGYNTYIGALDFHHIFYYIFYIFYIIRNYKLIINI